MNRTRLMTTMAVLVAIGTLGSQFLWFPAGIAKAYPVQHAVNVIAGIMLGPGPALAIAFMIGLLRNMLGIGSIMAFPGGMAGAFLAGYFYRKFPKHRWAVVGEIIGTGIIGALFSSLFATFLMGNAVGAFFFMPPFLVSSISGAFIGWVIVVRVKRVLQRQYISGPEETIYNK